MIKYYDEGTFGFCSACPAQSHCCRRIRISDELDAPFLMRGEGESISRVSGVSIADFVLEIETEAFNISSIKADGGKCFFYKAGVCTIYENRPFDCRLFPFDIIEKSDGNLFWIVYEKLCPVGFDFREYFAAAKELLRSSAPSPAELRKFAAYGERMVSEHQYRLIEPVSLSGSER